MIERRYTSFKDAALFEEAIALTMEMNSHYHKPEEIRDLMSEITGQKVPDSLRVFPLSIPILARTRPLKKMSFSTRAVISKIKEAFILAKVV